MTITVGETVPQGTFKYVPYTPELADGVSIYSLFKSNLKLIMIHTERLWNS